MSIWKTLFSGKTASDNTHSKAPLIDTQKLNSDIELAIQEYAYPDQNKKLVVGKCTAALIHNKEETLNYVEKLAEEGNPKAQWLMIQACLTGRRSYDADRIFKWLENAENASIKTAMVFCADLWEARNDTARAGLTIHRLANLENAYEDDMVHEIVLEWTYKGFCFECKKEEVLPLIVFLAKEKNLERAQRFLDSIGFSYK